MLNISSIVTAARTAANLIPGVKITRGNLIAATLKATVNSMPIEVGCHFNPATITVNKEISYNEQPQTGSSVPNTEFSTGRGKSIKLDLWFDSTDTGLNIRLVTEKLWKFARVDPANKRTTTGTSKAYPPDVTFTWNSFSLTGVVKSMSHSYVFFSESGAPLRCKVTLEIQERQDSDIPPITALSSALDAALRAKRLAGAMSAGAAGVALAMTSAAISAASASANSASSAARTASSSGVMPTQGTRIDHVAAATTGTTATQREVAANNNIDNPMKIPKGQVIR